MFSKKQQRKIIEKRFSNINLHLKAFCAANNEEHLHQLRVEIKRLQALGSFIDSQHHKKHFSKLLAPVKRMFGHAAKIRSAHIHIKLTKGIALKKFKGHQHKLQHEEWKKFAARKNTFIQQLEEAHNNTGQYIHPIKRKATIKWSKKQLQKAEGNLQAGALQFHDARKAIKKVLYIDELQTADTRLNIAYLKQTEDLVGKWHDVKETLTLLKRNYPTAKGVIKTLTAKKEKLADTIKLCATEFAHSAKK